MGPPWNKGHTKATHPSVQKMSETMKRRKIDNFYVWRERMRKIGKIKSEYPKPERNGDLAELIGVVLGDGHIHQFPRTQSLRIVSHSENEGFIRRYATIIEKTFGKRPHVAKRKKQQCTDITIYEKEISQRLKIPTGAKKYLKVKIPSWIQKSREYTIRYLRGLYEAEGTFCIHKPTYTYKFIFSNRNKSLLDNVSVSLKKLGFHPHRSQYKIQISRREEVYKARKMIKFREY